MKKEKEKKKHTYSVKIKIIYADFKYPITANTNNF